MSDIGGYSPSTGPERYIGRYSNAALAYAAWTYVTSASFYNAANAANAFLAADLQFLGLSVYNLGATPFYLLLLADPAPASDSPDVSSAILVLPNTRTPLTLDLGSISPAKTPPPTGIRSLALRGDADNSAASNILIVSSFAGAYGPV
jgi:hypothetical protein